VVRATSPITAQCLSALPARPLPGPVSNVCTRRSWDGLTLYAVSSDGTLAALAFTPDEMEGLAPASAQEQYLQKFGFVPPPLPAGYSHTALRERTPAPPAPVAHTNGTTTNAGGEIVNKLVAKRGNKRARRARLQDVPSAGGTGPPVDPSPFAAPFSTHRPLHEDVVMDDVPSFGGFDLPGPSTSGLADDKPPRGRTLGGERAREAAPAVVREITSTAAGAQAQAQAQSALFDAPHALTFLSARNADAADDVIEARNAESGGTCCAPLPPLSF
jgi:protein HIRA/HIR1